MNYPKTLEEQREEVIKEVVEIHYEKEVRGIQTILRRNHDIRVGYSKLLAIRDHYRNKIGFYNNDLPEGWANDTNFDDLKYSDKSPNSVKAYPFYDKLVSKRKQEKINANKVPKIHEVEKMSQALCVDLSDISMDDLSNEEITFYNKYNNF